MIHKALLLTLLLLGASVAQAQDARMANGVVIKGSVVRATAAGLEIQSQGGSKTYPWETLSSATRFRHQPTFRANFDSVLQGLPPSARTKLPDLEATSIDDAVVAKPETTTTTTQAPTAAATQEPTIIFDAVSYENVEPLSALQIPGLQLRASDLASYVGFQYGPGKNDVLYLVFDTKDASEVRDVMFVHAPGTAEFSTTQRVPGFKTGTGGNRVATFKKIKIPAKFGPVSASYEIECVCSGSPTNQLAISIYTELSKNDLRTRFTLVGSFADLLQGPGLVNIKGVLDLPVLWASLDLVTSTPRIVGNLNMSGMRVVPRDGMDARVSLVVNDDKGAAVQKESLKVEAGQPTDLYGIICPLKKLAPGQSYAIQASINLGPFIGPATFDDKFTLPNTP